MRVKVRVRLYTWVRAISGADICSEGLRILHHGVLCSIWLIENGNRQETQISFLIEAEMQSQALFVPHTFPVYLGTLV